MPAWVDVMSCHFLDLTTPRAEFDGSHLVFLPMKNPSQKATTTHNTAVMVAVAFSAAQKTPVHRLPYRSTVD